MGQRCSYLPLLTSTVRKHLTEVCHLPLVADDADVWYEFDGIPLKWWLWIALLPSYLRLDMVSMSFWLTGSIRHYPIGLLFDLYNHKRQLPWHITVHFSRFPTDKLIRVSSLSSMDAPHDYFMSLIKEADFIRNGSIKKVMGLSKIDQSSLWEGLCSSRWYYGSMRLKVFLTSMFCR